MDKTKRTKDRSAEKAVGEGLRALYDLSTAGKNKGPKFVRPPSQALRSGPLRKLIKKITGGS